MVEFKRSNINICQIFNMPKDTSISYSTLFERLSIINNTEQSVSVQSGLSTESTLLLMFECLFTIAY